MSFRNVFVAFSFFLVTAGCRNNDDEIHTYRISKEAAPMMPIATSAPASAPASAPDMQTMGAGMGMQPAAGSQDIQWTLPKGWIEQPASSMRVGSFLAKGSDGYEADISIVPLGGSAGGDLANINRWRGQINLDPITEAEVPQNSKHISPGGRSMLLVDFVSRDLEIENKYTKRLVAAVYEQGGRTWFFKMTGESKAVEEIKPTFLKFLETLRFNGAQ